MHDIFSLSFRSALYLCYTAAAQEEEEKVELS